MANKKSKVELKRINMNIPSSLYDEVRMYADKLGINITAAFIVLVNQGLNNQDTLEKLPRVLNAVLASREGIVEQDFVDEIEDLAKSNIHIPFDIE